MANKPVKEWKAVSWVDEKSKNKAFYSVDYRDVPYQCHEADILPLIKIPITSRLTVEEAKYLAKTIAECLNNKAILDAITP